MLYPCGNVDDLDIGKVLQHQLIVDDTYYKTVDATVRKFSTKVDDTAVDEVDVLSRPLVLYPSLASQWIVVILQQMHGNIIAACQLS